MGRWQPRNPKLPRAERIRLTRLGRDLILEIARKRSWRPTWESDDPFYVECVFLAGNPGLYVTLNACSVDGGLAWWVEPPEERWYVIEEAGEREAFIRSIDDWLEAGRGGSGREGQAKL